MSLDERIFYRYVVIGRCVGEVATAGMDAEIERQIEMRATDPEVALGFAARVMNRWPEGWPQRATLAEKFAAAPDASHSMRATIAQFPSLEGRS